jgi:DNA-directed RNA polymerase II subunit RPB7
MFFIKELEHSLVLHPSFFKAHMHAMLSQRLLQDLEGTVKRDYYIVCVLDNYQFGDGKVIPGSSSAEYQVHFRAIVWKPFRGEVVRVKKYRSGNTANACGSGRWYCWWSVGEWFLC